MHALRVHGADDVAHDAALAGGVHALDDEQHGAPAAALGLGVEPFLQVAQPRLQLAHDLLAVRLVAGEPGRRVRVEVGEAEAGADAQRVGPGDRLDRLVRAGLRGLLPLLRRLLGGLARELGVGVDLRGASAPFSATSAAGLRRRPCASSSVFFDPLPIARILADQRGCGAA